MLCTIAYRGEAYILCLRNPLHCAVTVVDGKAHTLDGLVSRSIVRVMTCL